MASQRTNLIADLEEPVLPANNGQRVLLGTLIAVIIVILAP